MKSVGEVMAIGRTIHESLQKALRGLETGLSGFNFVERLKGATHDQLRNELAPRTPDRLLNAAQANRGGLPRADNHHVAGNDKWFLELLGEHVAAEEDGDR